jgi:hypothetical protein
LNSSRLDEIGARIWGLKDKIDTLEHAEKDKETTTKPLKKCEQNIQDCVTPLKNQT